MNWLAILIAAILKALLPAAVQAAKPTAEDARAQPHLRERLRRRVRRAWPMAILFALALAGPGCARTVYVPYGEPVRLRETVRNVKVWVHDANGKPAAGRMDLPEGWYALPVEPEGD